MLKCPAARLRRAILLRHVEREGGRAALGPGILRAVHKAKERAPHGSSEINDPYITRSIASMLSCFVRFTFCHMLALAVGTHGRRSQRLSFDAKCRP